MNRVDESGVLFILLLMAVLIGLAAFIPSNGLTGYVVQEPTCDDGSCLELCDTDTCTMEGAVCCQTLWSSGVCDLPSNCQRVFEYSERQSLEVYQDTFRDNPDVVQNWSRFLVPIAVTFMILLYFVFRRKNPHW